MNQCLVQDLYYTFLHTFSSFILCSFLVHLISLQRKTIFLIPLLTRHLLIFSRLLLPLCNPCGLHLEISKLNTCRTNQAIQILEPNMEYENYMYMYMYAFNILSGIACHNYFRCAYCTEYKKAYFSLFCHRLITGSSPCLPPQLTKGWGSCDLQCNFICHNDIRVYSLF